MNGKPTFRARPSFDGNTPVAVVEFQQPEKQAADERAKMRQEIMVRLIQFLTVGRDAKKAGRDLLIMAYVCQKTDCRSQRELANRLGVSPGRASQMIKLFRQKVADF